RNAPGGKAKCPAMLRLYLKAVQFRSMANQTSGAAKTTWLRLPGHHQWSNGVRFAGDFAPQSVGDAFGRALDSRAHLAWSRKAAINQRRQLWPVHGSIGVHAARSPWHGQRAESAGHREVVHAARQTYPLTVNGYLKRAWLDADRKPVTFYFYSSKGADPRRN